MSDTAHVARIPQCDFCTKDAAYDAKTLSGPWAYMCTEHWPEHRYYAELGTGKGQRLMVGEKPKPDKAQRRKDAAAALAANDMDAFEEAVGDGDPAEFL